MISIKNLNKSFWIPHERHFSLRSRILNAFKKSSSTELHVLKDVNIEIDEGECVGIIGRNGCGKSTLLKIIAGIIEADTGEVLVKGGISPFLELGVGFNHELTVYDNIYLYGSVLGLTGKEIDDKFDSMIEFSGLENFVDAKLKTLSSGMQVRAAFSVASAVDRSIYLADEVLAVGDINFQEKCLKVYRDMQANGKTIVFVSHSLLSIEEFCNRAIWINDGKVAAVGDTKDVIAQYLEFMQVPDKTSTVSKTRSGISQYRVVTMPTGDLLVESPELKAFASFHKSGDLSDLHLSLYDSNNTLVPLGQKQSLELIKTHLPPSPCRILEVCTNMQMSSSIFDLEDYEVTRICPDGGRVLVAKTGVPNNVTNSTKEFVAREKGFEAVVLHESSRQIDSLRLFDIAESLLTDGGKLMIMDQFSSRLTSDGSGQLHYLPEFIHLAERFGFKKLENIDISDKVIPTISGLVDFVEKSWGRLSSDELLKDGQLSGSYKALKLYKEQLEEGHCVYSLLLFVKESTPKWNVQIAGSDDSQEIRNLFKTVFKQDLTQNFWDWKYGQGRGCAVVVKKDGQIISHYGGMSRDILYKGEKAKAVQNGDVMVLPSERGSKRPFLFSAATFLEKYVGYESKYLVAFGFPNARAMRLPEILGLYSRVGSIVELSWKVLNDEPASLGHEVVSFENGNDHCLAIDELWENMASGFNEALIGIRDWDYLSFRYLKHPDRKYDVLLIKNIETSKPQGVIVLQEEESRMMLADLVCPVENLSLMVKYARYHTSKIEAGTLYTWISKSYSSLISDDAQVSDLDIAIPTNIWSPGPSPEELDANWWLMIGDTDFH